MRLLVEVTGRPLNMRGPIYHVGERLFLDTDNPQHREVLEAPGWVRQVMSYPPGPASSVSTAPPAHKMVTSTVQRGKDGRFIKATTSEGR